jgi:hypothetical protein
VDRDEATMKLDSMNEFLRAEVVVLGERVKRGILDKEAALEEARDELEREKDLLAQAEEKCRQLQMAAGAQAERFGMERENDRKLLRELEASSLSMHTRLI